MKPGYQTSEFWLSLAAVAVGALLSSGALDGDGALAKALGVAAAALASAGYAYSRGMAKSQ